MKLHHYIDFFQNMGLRYVLFRTKYIAQSKLGLLKNKFPTNPKFTKFINLEQWKKKTPPFFFKEKNAVKLPKYPSLQLKQQVEDLKEGKFIFFNKLKFDLGKEYDWITNPETGYQYDIQQHFTQIQDLSKEAGDIKYVWEKARFSFLYDIIRYDYHFEDDQSEYVFSQIEDFIDKNPINQGPNYKCSQETSLRILNWTFVLYYYKNSIYLTETLFNKIINAIYWQLHHVYQNINFSRIAVRNNHAITETLMLYLSKLLFPFIPETKKWSKKGKKWFQEEIAYQIYEDGTFLQFSMNYHRVVVQLLTWGIQLAKLNKDTFTKIVYQNAEKSLLFLDNCLNPKNGALPNYGSNDGALFFKFTDDDYRNYKSQLDDLRAVLKNEIAYNTESYHWYGIENPKKIPIIQQEIGSFSNGGYYLINDTNSKTFIKCGSYKDRPAQSDNLHLDIWVDGMNYIRDSGSYKYNTEKKYTNYFNGCQGHNTVSVSGKDQMLKGSRFIWYYWIKKAKATLTKNTHYFEFKGSIEAFKHIAKNIKHQRSIKKQHSKHSWEVEDKLFNKGKRKIYLFWNVNPTVVDTIEIITKDMDGNILKPNIEEKWFSSYYGIKEKSIQYIFETTGDTFTTMITINKSNENLL